VLEHLLRVFFPLSLPHRSVCPAKVPEISTEKIPDENKIESAVQTMSSGSDQPGCAAPIHINMQCTGACDFHSKVSLTHRRCSGLAEIVQRKPASPMPPIQHALKKTLLP